MPIFHLAPHLAEPIEPVKRIEINTVHVKINRGRLFVAKKTARQQAGRAVATIFALNSLAILQLACCGCLH